MMSEELKIIELNADNLEGAAGGVAYGSQLKVGSGYLTQVQSDYLALRTAPSYDYYNEIGPLWNGSIVIVDGKPIGEYVLVHVHYTAAGPHGTNLTGRKGYVNWNYLTPYHD